MYTTIKSIAPDTVIVWSPSKLSVFSHTFGADQLLAEQTMPLATHGDTLFLKQLLQKIRLSLIQTAMESIPAPMMLVSCAEPFQFRFVFPHLKPS